MLNHASELGINSNQIAIGGESAGGGLTAALTYIQHLQDANVEANCNVYKGMYHAFDMMEPENPTSLQPLFLPRSVDLMKSLLLWQLCSAIYHHDDKLVIDSPMDELLKDADVIDHCFKDSSKPIKEKEQKRYENLCKELGL